MSNPTKIYNDYVRANLPNTMTFNSSTARYNINNHSFFSFNRANWYFKYITKFGYTSLSVYAVNNFDPDLVFDFKQNYYRTGGTETTLSSAVTHARAGNATMVDSDGLLKWAPHNILIRSEELNRWTQSGTGSVVVDNAVAPDGTTTAATLTISSVNLHRYIRSSATYTAGDKITFSFWVRSDTVTTLPFGINGGTNGANNYIFSDVAVTSTWQLVEFEFTVLGSDTSLYYIIGKQSTNPVNNQLGDIEIWHPHAYRSDLGGMVNNSATGNSYVPTTNSAVYAPRVGHHVYNGSAWVNEGILHESEARTNLYRNSNQFVSPWSQIGSTTTASAGTSPSGLADAWRWVGNGTSILYQDTPYVAGDYTVSAWVKSNGAGEDTFRLYALNGIVSSDFTATSEWVRYSHTFTSASAVNQFSGILYGASRENVDLLVYGLQLEEGSTASSYIPTSGSTVTRAADILTVPAANLPYSSTNVSIQMDGRVTYADDGATAFFYRWLLNSTNYAQAVLQTMGNYEGRIRFSQRETTSGYDELGTSGSYFTPDINVPFNISSRHGSTFINGAEGGTALTANTTVTALPDLSSNDLLLANTFMGTIGKFRVWDEDLTDAGIVEAST